VRYRFTFIQTTQKPKTIRTSSISPGSRVQRAAQMLYSMRFGKLREMPPIEAVWTKKYLWRTHKP
jgi:hypothetical protein